MKRFSFVLCLAVISASSSTVFAGDLSDPSLLDSLEWRSIGPAVMGGRISDIVGVPGDIAKVYAAAGSGGLFRSDDGGITWSSIFDHQSTISIGAIALQSGNADNNPNTIWVGTGESNVRNSVSFGDGVYKSTDGGASWQHVGLEDTETIARIIVNPSNPQNVFVAAVGHPFGPNEERGVFVTQDGGKTWRKTLYIDPEHGASSIEIDPANPRILYAGMWHFDRKPWTYTSGDEKGGLFKSTDGGTTWTKLTNGLPKLMGRVGVKVSPSDPKTVYVIAETKEGTLFRSNDAGATFECISKDRELVGRAYYFTDMRVAPDDSNHIMVLADALLESHDGGKQFRRMSPVVHGDLHALWIDPKDPRRIWQGNDGGLAVTYDAGAHWEQVNNIPLGQFYHASADVREPFYNVTVGMQDNGSWTGPSRTQEPAGIFNDDWRMVNPFTGFNSLAEADDPDIILSEQPGGALLRMNTRTREQQTISPQPRSYGGAPASEMKYRFNWDAPLVRSPHGKSTIYLAGNVVFQSSDYGNSWEAISHDLTNDDKSRLGNIGGPISIDNSASEVYSTITTLSESPANGHVIWVGTDDGNVQVTTNGGGDWTNVAHNVPAVPSASPVSHVEASKVNESTAYVSLDRHMFDDMRPYIFKTTDGGKTWTSITAGLPEKAFVWIIREDPREPKLLYAGTELGLFASFNGGENWLPLHLKNMPWSVAVRDIVVQPESNDLLIATHGRSLWILDDATPLQQLAHSGSSSTQLFPVRSALRFTVRPTRFGFGDKTFVGKNPPYGAVLTYYLPANVDNARVQILDGTGREIRTFAGSNKPGVHQIVWDLRYAVPGGVRAVPAISRTPGRGPAARGPQALPGTYTARLIAGGANYDQAFEVKLDPALHVDMKDLQAQFNVTRDLVTMQFAVGSLLNRLAQLKADHPEQVASLSAELARPADMGRSETGPRLRENLEALFNMIDNVNAAPTEAQMHYYAELQAQYQAVLARADALFKTTNAPGAAAPRAR